MIHIPFILPIHSIKSRDNKKHGIIKYNQLANIQIIATEHLSVRAAQELRGQTIKGSRQQLKRHSDWKSSRIIDCPNEKFR